MRHNYIIPSSKCFVLKVINQTRRSFTILENTYSIKYAFWFIFRTKREKNKRRGYVTHEKYISFFFTKRSIIINLYVNICIFFWSSLKVINQTRRSFTILENIYSIMTLHYICTGACIYFFDKIIIFTKI
jgi:hypothetical protein